MKKLILLTIIFLYTQSAYSQEINGKVIIMHDRISGVDASVFQSLERALTELINNRSWTNDNFKPHEKIDCTFTFNLQGRTDDNVFNATLNIQASRPVYNTNYSTSLVNYIDRDVIFKYDESSVVQFDYNQISGNNALSSNLTAITAYYIYIILGLDYDSYALNGGTNYLQSAQYIVNNAPEEGKNIKGWKAMESQRNRYWLIDQLLNNKFSAVRIFWYNYHRLGLDELSNNPEQGRNAILQQFASLESVNKDNPSSMILQFIFNSKSSELINILQQTPPEIRKPYIEQISKIDITNANRYRNIK